MWRSYENIIPYGYVPDETRLASILALRPQNDRLSSVHVVFCSHSWARG
jgi:hypothetical protein